MEFLQSETIAELSSALAAAQKEMEAPQRTKIAEIEGETRTGTRYKYKYKYAPLEEVTRVIKDPLSNHKVSWRQGVVTTGNALAVRTCIMHSSGQWFASDYPIHATKPGAQGFASAASYSRRYGLTLALGIAAEDDDDGNAADGVAADIKGKSQPTTNGATRTAAPRPAEPPAHAAASNGNGGRPKWITDFFARPSYEIDRNKLSGWSEWEKAYCQAADSADDLDQLLKLENDNAAHFSGFRENVRKPVYEAFRARIEANEKRLWRTPDPASLAV